MAALIGPSLAAGIAYAGFPDSPYKQGDILTADSLNAGFDELAVRVNAAAPPGTVIAYAGEVDKNPDEAGSAPASPPPPGWLLCNGAQLNGIKYKALYKAIGTRFGGDVGSETFRVPDLRGRTPMGAGQGQGLTARALGAALGEEAHVLTKAELPAHDHGGTTGTFDANHTHRIPTNQNGGSDLTASWASGNKSAGASTLESHANFVTSINLNHSHAISSEGSSQPHNTIQPSMVMNFLIKY